MSDIIKGVITSRNTIIEEMQGPSHNNINNISSYQEKTILTLDNGSQYSTHLKVDAQPGDKVALLLNSETHDIETILDKDTYSLLSHGKSAKVKPLLCGLSLFSIMFGFLSIMHVMNINPDVKTYLSSYFFIINFTSSLITSAIITFCANNSRKEYKKEEDKNLNIQMELKDFFEQPSGKKFEYVMEFNVLKI